jgi:hypothetical protein
MSEKESSPPELRVVSSKEENPSLAKLFGDLDIAVENHLKWSEKERAASLEAQREDTRSSFGNIIVRTFAASVCVFVLVGCGIAAFSDEAHLKSLINVVQAVGAIISPIVGFVIGHYFASKDAR